MAPFLVPFPRGARVWGLRYNESCLVDAYLDFRADVFASDPASYGGCSADPTLAKCTPAVYLSRPLLQPACDECTTWTSPRPDIG